MFFGFIRNTRARKIYIQLHEKSINLLYSGYLCAPRGWNDRYRSYSTSSDTVNGIRRIDLGATLLWCAVHATNMAYRKPMSIFPLLACTCVDVKTCVSSCGTIETWITWSAFQPQCREVPTYTFELNGTHACDALSQLQNRVSSISSAPLLLSRSFFRSRIFPFHLRPAISGTSPAMQIVFCRKMCRFAAEEGNATERM